jgi:hypothetical protein
VYLFPARVFQDISQLKIPPFGLVYSAKANGLGAILDLFCENPAKVWPQSFQVAHIFSWPFLISLAEYSTSWQHCLVAVPPPPHQPCSYLPEAHKGVSLVVFTCRSFAVAIMYKQEAVAIGVNTKHSQLI